MATGEKGGKYTFKGMRFYRIIDMFIDQAGAGQGAVWGGSFDDDPGGLALKHDKPGLLSAANGGPNTNSGHFSIVVSPAPHLNGGYTVCGETLTLTPTLTLTLPLTLTLTLALTLTLTLTLTRSSASWSRASTRCGRSTS